MAMEEALQQGTEQVRTGTEKIRQQFDKTSTQLKNKAEDTWEDVSDVIRKHPGKAIGISLLAGLAIGSLVVASSRRKNSYNPGQFKDLADSGLDAWDRVKEGFTEAVSALKSALDDASGKFK